MGNLLLLAIRKDEGEWIYNPPPTLTLEKDMRLIVLATPEERQILHGALRFETAPGRMKREAGCLDMAARGMIVFPRR